MSERLNKFIHSRVFVAILILVLICTTLLVGTYAWFTWSSTDNTRLVMSIGKMADVTFMSGNAIDGELSPVYDYSDGLTTKFSINNRDISGTIIGYKVNLNITTIDSELISEDVKWTLTKGGKIYKEGDFSTISDGTTITLDSGNLSTGTTFYAFYLYIDGNVENDPSMMGKTITGNIMVEANGTGVNLLEHITDLYTNADKTVVTNNGIDYNYATSVRLMNDRLGDSNVEVDSGNIRYYGADDSNLNNYIYFNCSNYNNQSSDTCETWRIIGIVDGKVKLIKSDSIGEYAWDYNSNGTFDNNWSDSTLNTLLNTTYYNSGSTTYYNGSTTGTNVSFTSNGITAATRNANLISESTWYTNGMSDSDIYANASYEGERTGTSTYLSNIGLAYPSDYGYGADLNTCTNAIYNYEAEECTSVNWLTTMFTTDDWYWLITPYSDDSDYAWGVVSGCVSSDYYAVGEAGGVVPVLYLDTELFVNKGNGSSDNPYQIYVELVTPVDDFEYYLGTETSSVDVVQYYHINNGKYYDFDVMGIPLAENEILLTRYIGDSKNVNVPSVYSVDGIDYNVVLFPYEFNLLYDSETDSDIDAEIGVFIDNTNIESVSLADGVLFRNSSSTNNMMFLFARCTNLVNVSKIPSTVTSMHGTFLGCTSLTKPPEIPNVITSIHQIFVGCTGLVTAPEIPSSVTSMGYAFSGCTNLTGTVRINSSNVTSVSYIFRGTSNAITVEVPAGSTTYSKLNALTTSNGKPSNVTLSTFDAS